MASLPHYLYTCACNNAWANHRLLAAVARLSEAEFGAPRTSYFPSLRATLNHNLTVDWYYLDALERALDGRPPNADAYRYFEPEEPFSACVPLSEAQRASDRRLVEACARLTDALVDLPVPVVRRSGVAVEVAHRLLGHLFQHQVHHRGQAHAMLAGTAVAPPQLDEFYCAGDAPLRAAELAELGIPEENGQRAPS